MMASMDDGNPTLEQRVAAIEAALTPAVTFPPLTDEQAAGLRERFTEALHQQPQPLRIIPPPPPIGPDEVRALLRECVTVIGPDDVLVMRIRHLTPDMPGRIREQVAAFNEANGTSVKLLAVDAEELAVAAGS